MGNSEYWLRHFRQNLSQDTIDWEKEAYLSPDENQQVLKGLKAWQKGETSDGRHLLKAARRYAQKTGQADYVAAIQLFIKEEQKHGENLGIFIDRIGEERIEFDWGDALFRQVRYLFGSMEIWTVTVLTVESAAQLFYQSLQKGVESPLLKNICQDILHDEAYHLRFQQERLWEILSRRKPIFRLLSLGVYTLFFNTVARIIWLAHKPVFQAGGLTRDEFLDRMTRRLERYFLVKPDFGWKIHLQAIN